MSRGAIVNEAALVDALEEGHLAGAGLDVTATEPLPGGRPAVDGAEPDRHPAQLGDVELTTDLGWSILSRTSARFVRGEELVKSGRQERGW